MKYTILFVLVALVMSIVFIACSSSKNNTDEASARKGEASNINVKHLSRKWKHVKTKDSYDGIWKEVTSDHKIITFSKDGKYTELKPGNDLCEGGYTTQGENVVLTHSCNKETLTCRVASLSKKELTLCQRGRHGEVFYVYQKIR